MKYIFIFFSFFSSFVKINSKLLFVFEHIRHGARGPWQAVNMSTMTDDLNETWNGIGELTPSGMRMHYLLGTYIKNKYQNFYNSSFDPNEILVYSSDINRTITSAYSNLQGMFPQTSGPVLNSKQSENAKVKASSNYSDFLKNEIEKLGNAALPNQMNILPIHIFNKYERQFLLHDANFCPGVKKVKLASQFNSKHNATVKELAKNFNNTFGEKLFKYYNLTDPDYYFDRTNLYRIADIFICDYFDRREMKNFPKEGINLEEFYKFSLNISFIFAYELEFNDPDFIVPTLAASPIFRSLIGWMDKRIELDKEGKSDEVVAGAPRFVVYSGHDTSLAASSYFLQKHFGIPLNSSDFAAYQVFELRKNDTNYYIKFVYNNETYKEEFDYNSFKEKVEKNIWSEEKIKNFCEDKGVNIYMIITLALFAVSFILFLLLSYLLWF